MARKPNPKLVSDLTQGPGTVLRGALHRVERSKPLGLSISAVLIASVGLLDYITGYEIGFALFYLFPVMLSTWVGGRWGGIASAIACALLWLSVEMTAGRPYYEPLSPFWNATMRLGIFVIVAFLVLYVKNMLEFERTISRTDYLTGIANRRAFVEAVDLESLRSKRFHHSFSLAYIDIDKFKKLNDMAGHQTGDIALRMIAKGLEESVREVDLVARTGGDEFAILLPECGEAAARKVISRCISACSLKIKSQNWPIGLSVGVGIFNRGNYTVEELLALTDETMYQSKHSDTRKIHYTSFEEQDTDIVPPDPLKRDEQNDSASKSAQEKQ